MKLPIVSGRSKSSLCCKSRLVICVQFPISFGKCSNWLWATSRVMRLHSSPAERYTVSSDMSPTHCSTETHTHTHLSLTEQSDHHLYSPISAGSCLILFSRMLSMVSLDRFWMSFSTVVMRLKRRYSVVRDVSR